MNSPSSPTLSVVIPAYNEARVIAATLATVTAHLTRTHVTYELLVVDDGSTDATAAIVRALAPTDPSLHLLAGPHRGKGGAVKTGVRAARGRFVLFLDADLSTPIDQWEAFAPLLAAGTPVVIGSRKMPGATVAVRQSFLRESLGKCFTYLSRALATGWISDVTCGFKAFDRVVAQRLVALQRLDGWAFDAELLFIARRLGYPIREIPVTWRDDPASKVHMLRDGLAAFRDLLAIRLGALRGFYPRS